MELFQYKDMQKQNDDSIYTQNIISSGDTFGLNEFFTNQTMECNARSNTISHVLVCDRDDFLQVLKLFPLDHEKFCQIKDEI